MSDTPERPPLASRLRPAGSRIRTVLVHAQAEPSERPRLTAAAALAEALDARLIGLAAELSPTGLDDPLDLLTADELKHPHARVADHLMCAQAAFERSAEGLESRWLAFEGHPTRSVATTSREADLIVAGGSARGFHDPNRWCDPGALALISGRPVLVVPSSGGRLSAEAVVVAWKDTREARRALADSLPFLCCADEVVVLEVCSEGEFGDAEARTFGVVEGLRRHGVKATARCVIAAAERAAEEIKLTAADLGADLIVAGGYGRSRLGEWILGGVTHDLLADPERFLLLSH